MFTQLLNLNNLNTDFRLFIPTPPETMPFFPEDYFPINRSAHLQDFEVGILQADLNISRPPLNPDSFDFLENLVGTQDFPLKQLLTSCDEIFNKSKCTPKGSVRRKRAIISALEACQIYSLKKRYSCSIISVEIGDIEDPCNGNSTRVSKLFGISPSALLRV